MVRYFDSLSVRVVLALMIGVLAGVLAGVASHSVNRAPALGPLSHAYGVEAIRQATRSQMIDGAVVFIGDSQTVALATSTLPGKTENFGISSDTVAGALGRVQTYKLDRAKTVVLQIGGNDLPLRDAKAFEDNYRKLLAAIPVPVIAMAVFPGADQTGEVNKLIHGACAAQPRCRFLTLTPQFADERGRPRPEFFGPDGIHLSPAGLKLWADTMRTMVP